MIQLPQVQGPKWLTWVGLAAVGVYGAGAYLGLWAEMPAEKVIGYVVLGLTFVAGWVSPSPIVRTGAKPNGNGGR